VTAPIEVLEVWAVQAGNLRAFVKVRLGAVVIHGVRVVQQPNQAAWVALPQQPARKKADGTGSGWYPIIEITNPELMRRIRDAVLEAWRQYQARPRIDQGQDLLDDTDDAIALLRGDDR
jgi:DNA-binding cell septation regulator SpoVG